MGLRNWVKMCFHLCAKCERDIWADFPLEIQSFDRQEAGRECHNTGCCGIETISCQLGLTSRLCVARDTVLKNLGMSTEFNRDKGKWS